jgi:DNA polymerase III delta prime subunit
MPKLESLLIHPHTLQSLNNFISNPTQALMVTGSVGSGKRTICLSLASELLQTRIDKNVEDEPYFMHLQKQKGKKDIAIEQVRELIKALRLKVPGENKVRRVVFIEDAQNLSIPAQNAILKILEEPSAETVFILSSTSVLSVLPTISSRTQIIPIQASSLSSVKKYYKDVDSSVLESAWRLSKGNVGLLSLLLNGSEHPLKIAVEETKAFLRANKYERLIMADKLSRDRDTLNYFLDALSRTLSVLHHQAIIKQNQRLSDSLLLSRKLTQQAQTAIKQNANTKLVALNLSLGLVI